MPGILTASVAVENNRPARYKRTTITEATGATESSELIAEERAKQGNRSLSEAFSVNFVISVVFVIVVSSIYLTRGRHAL
jgi:hypothetical protein